MGIRPARGKKGDDEEPKKPQGGPRPSNAEFFQTNDQGAYIVPDFEDADKKGEENHYCRAHLTDKYGNRMKDGQGKLLMCPQSGNFSSRRSLKDHLCRTHREQGRPVEVERRSSGKAKGRQGQAMVYNRASNLISQSLPSSNHETQSGYQPHGGAQYEYPSPSHGDYDWKGESRQPRIFEEPALQYQQHSNERPEHSPAQSRPTSTYSEPAIEIPQQHYVYGTPAHHSHVARQANLEFQHHHQYQPPTNHTAPANNAREVGRGDFKLQPPSQHAVASNTPAYNRAKFGAPHLNHAVPANDAPVYGRGEPRAQPLNQYTGNGQAMEFNGAHNLPPSTQSPLLPTHPRPNRPPTTPMVAQLTTIGLPAKQLWDSRTSHQ